MKIPISKYEVKTEDALKILVSPKSRRKKKSKRNKLNVVESVPYENWPSSLFFLFLKKIFKLVRG